MITYEWSDWRNGLFWWIQSVYVAPDWRRRGVYRGLYEYVQEQAASEGVVDPIVAVGGSSARDNPASKARPPYAS